jgi:alpha-beta hydrolase superfamily lysophospholipase
MSTPQRFHYTSSDCFSIACVKWGSRNAPGVVQITHGLGEHIGRYAEPAETLAQVEFVVSGNDHRSHGLTRKPKENFGDFGPDGFDQLVEDMVSLRVIAKKEHSGKPYVLLGHPFLRHSQNCPRLSAAQLFIFSLPPCI